MVHFVFMIKYYGEKMSVCLMLKLITRDVRNELLIVL